MANLLQLFVSGFGRLVGIVSVEVDARRHLVVGVQFGQAQDAFDHFGIGRCEVAMFGRDFKNGDQLGVGERSSLVLKRLGESSGGKLEGYVERREDRSPEEQQPSAGWRQLFRIFEREAFGRDFAEDQEPHRS